MSPKRILVLLAGLVVALSPLGAQSRRDRIDVDHYTIQANVNPRTQSIEATVAVRFLAMEERVSSVTLELNNALQVTRVVDGVGRELNASRDRRDYTVRVSLIDPVEPGQAETLTFTYDGRLTGDEESPVYGIRFAAIQNDYTYLMYPARWFPVNDYTVDRFSAQTAITVPQGYRVVGSGLDSSAPAGEQTTYTFDYTRASFPGSIAVVQSLPFRVTAGGVTTSLYLRGDSAHVAQAYGEEVGRVMTMLTGHFGLPPQADLSVIQTEDGAPSGYSAPGLLFLSPGGLGTDVNARLLVNQIARQWWGNLVSPVSRNHIWIANAFAREAELLWLEETQGPGAVEAELKSLYVDALAIDDVPVLQASRLEDYSPEYWAISSSKGVSVLAMLKAIIGEDAFAALLKKIPTDYAWQAVSTDQIRQAAEMLGNTDLRGFFIQWFESTGAPEFKLEYTVFRTQQGFRVMGKISQDLDTFRMPVKLNIETEGNPEEKTVEVVGTSSEFIVDTFGRPKKVNIDPDGQVLRYSPDMRVAVAIRRGEMFFEIAEFGDALKEYQRALDVNRNSSLAHYRVAEVFFLQRNYQSAANEFREALNGDGEPRWTEVWSHIKLGMIFDITGQRERAVNEYNLAVRTKDNTQGAQEDAAKYLETPYERGTAY